MRDKLIAESIVSFTNGYNVDECILGQKSRFELNNRFDMEVMLPHGEIKEKGLFGEMVAPYDYNGDADIEWGMYSPASKHSLPSCRIESVYVRIWACEDIDLNAIDVGLDNPLHIIKRTLTKLLMNVRVINPKCVMRINGRQFDSGSIERMKFAQLSSEGVMEEWSVGSHILGEFYDALNKRQLIMAFNNLHNDVSVPYSIYESARFFFETMDLRNCILSLATMVEVVYKQKMDEYFKKNNIPVKLREYLKKNTDGISKYNNLFKKLDIEYHEKDIRDIMPIRNRVIHANYQPTGKEVIDAYIAGGNFIKEYRIPMFIKIK